MIETLLDAAAYLGGLDESLMPDEGIQLEFSFAVAPLGAKAGHEDHITALVELLLETLRGPFDHLASMICGHGSRRPRLRAAS